MKLIFGLGNPGREYQNTRHNVGFAALDSLADSWGATWQEKSKFKAQIAEATFEGEKVILAKPNTFYNLAGESARAICDFYKIPINDVLAIHDELALPFGTIRARIGGSDAGNNGIKSLITHIGQDFARIRIGINDEHLATIGAHDFVLARLSSDQNQLLPKITGHTIAFTQDFISNERTFAHDSVKI